ncbi:hypothetical protein JXA63_03535 [Candidatus Woesebacteria bacterium]|nr:hypothetical protein [Candidatus Woesebacteria bacterium]
MSVIETSYVARDWIDFIAPPDDYDQRWTHIERTIQKTSDCVEGYKQKFQTYLKNWEKDPGTFFNQGFSIEVFLELRLLAALGNISVTSKPWESSFPVLEDFEKAKPFLEKLKERGVIVERDLEKILGNYGGGAHYDFEGLGIF